MAFMLSSFAGVVDNGGVAGCDGGSGSVPSIDGLEERGAECWALMVVVFIFFNTLNQSNP